MNYSHRLKNGNISKRRIRASEFWFDVSWVFIIGGLALVALYWREL